MIYANSVKIEFIYSIFKRELNEIMSKKETKKIVVIAKELSSDDEYIRLFENGEAVGVGKTEIDKFHLTTVTGNHDI